MGKVFAVLFFGVFAAAGLGFFGFMAVPMVGDWYSARSWEPVTATLVSHELKVNRSDDSDTYRAQARYHYDYFGQRYTSDRVGFSVGSDNIGSYHEDMNDRLRQVMAAGGQFEIWVNPDNPAESVIDRGLRVGLLFFHLIFLLIFGGIGLGGIYYMFRAKPEPDPDAIDPSQPWLGRDEWSSATVYSNSKASAKAMLFFAVFWNLVSLGGLFAAYSSFQEGNWLGLIALIFPAVGVGLIVYYAKLQRSINRFGATPLTLDPYPGSIGGQLGGAITFSRPFQSEPVTRRVIIQCLRHYRSGDDTHERVEWQERMVPAWQHSASDRQLEFCFDVPDHLPAAEDPKAYPRKSWRLSLELEFADGTKLERTFENLPVFPTAQASRIRNLEAHASTSRSTREARSKVVDDLIQVQSGASGHSINYPFGRNKAGLFMALFGFVFVVVGWFVPDTIITVVFILLGGLVTVFSIYWYANSLDVQIAPEGITTDRYVFGFKIKQSFLPSYSFKEFRERKSHSTSGGGKTTQYYDLLAHGYQGEKLVVAENLNGMGEVRAAIEKLSVLITGYQT